MEGKVYNQEGKEKGVIKLPEEIFGLSWNADLVHQTVTSLLSSRRAGTAHTKNRGEVRGGGKKPWRQKGTGRARHGSRRSPIWVGGGVTHGPRKDKNYDRKVNAKESAKALSVVLSKKFKDGEILFVDDVKLKNEKTKEGSRVLSSLSKVGGFEKLWGKSKNTALVSLPEKNVGLSRSLRNISKIVVGEARNLNVVDALKSKFILVIDPDKTLKLLEKRLLKK